MLKAASVRFDRSWDLRCAGFCVDGTMGTLEAVAAADNS